MQATFCPYCLKLVATETCPYCGSNVNYAGNPMHLPVGSTLNGAHPYVLGACRGQGGFGVTYIALDAMTNARVAVKEYFPTYCSGRTSGQTVQSYYGQEESYEKGKERFLDEARMLQSLSDLSGVVNVVDFFEANNTAYLVMEFLDGCSLKDHVIKNGRIPARQFLNQLRPLLQDIESMHQRGVIHRDIAPDNIILQPDGRLKLIDFGAARSYLGEKSMSVVVKKGFAPVEQYLRTGLNASTDVYAIAASIYFCITGMVPPDSAERQYGDLPMQSPISMGADLTPAQEQALARALEIQPKNRTQTVAQFIGELYGEIPVEETPVKEAVIEEKKEPFAFKTETDPGNKQEEKNAEKREEKKAQKQEEREEASDQKLVPTKGGSKKMIISIVAFAAAIALVALLALLPKMNAYNKACNQLNNGAYYRASQSFLELGNYRDSANLYKVAYYQYGLELYNDQDFKTAIQVFKVLSGYEDSLTWYSQSRYAYGKQLLEQGEYDLALDIFKSMGSYSDSQEMIDEIKYQFVIHYSGNTHNELLFDQLTGKPSQTIYASDDAGKVYEYLSELAKEDYKDSKELYQEIYGWKATVVNFSDMASRKALINKYNSNLFSGDPYRVLKELTVRQVEDFDFIFLITGGAPGETVDLYAEYSWPDGSSGEWDLDWNNKKHNSYASAGWSSSVNFIRAGKFTVRICIRGTGECIGEYTMTVK